MKFNIGDIVIGNSRAARYMITGPGWVGEVTGVSLDHIKVRGPDWNGEKAVFFVLSKCFNLVQQEPSAEEFMSALLAP